MNQDQVMDYEAMAVEAEANNSGGDPSWTGEVDGYALKEIQMHENGAAMLIFHQPADEKGYTNKLFLNPVDFENIPVYDGQTKEAAIVKAIQKENRLLKQLARNYAEADVVDAAFKDVKGFENKIKALESCLPPNVGEITGRIVIGYNAKGYLTIPNRLQWDGDSKRWLPFFSTNPDQQLMDLPNNLSRSKPQVDTEVQEDEVVDY